MELQKFDRLHELYQHLCSESLWSFGGGLEVNFLHWTKRIKKFRAVRTIHPINYNSRK